MVKGKSEALYGNVELLVLKTLSAGGPMHGLAIARQIEALSDEFLRLEEGALYPALHRLRRRGLVESEWRISAKRRRAKFYTLTASGRAELRRQIKDWIRHTSAVRKVLDVAWGDIS